MTGRMESPDEISGEQLRLAREHLRVDQAWLARRLNVSVDEIDRLESRSAQEISPDMRRDIQRVLRDAGVIVLAGGIKPVGV